MRLDPPFRWRLLFANAALVLFGNLGVRSAFAAAPGRTVIPLEANKDRFGDPLPRYAYARLGTVRWRHGSQVISVAYHPDGKTRGSGRITESISLM